MVLLLMKKFESLDTGLNFSLNFLFDGLLSIVLPPAAADYRRVTLYFNGDTGKSSPASVIKGPTGETSLLPGLDNIPCPPFLEISYMSYFS